MSPSSTAPNHHFIGATITRDAGHPLGRVLGDGLVRFPSAAGHGTTRRVPFELDDGSHLGGLHHLDLLDHPMVYEQLRAWLAGGAVRRGPVSRPDGAA